MRPFFPGQIAPQIDDGIPHQLSGPVIRHIAAAVDLVQLDSLGGQQLVARQHMFPPGVAPQRQHRRMLEQQQGIADRARLPRRDDATLNLQRLRVPHPSQRNQMDEIQIVNPPLNEVFWIGPDFSAAISDSQSMGL
jgi:hypothetical protein